MFLSQNEQALADALREKANSLETIQEITRLQETLFDQEEDVVALMDNIELRQQWIDYVDKLDEQIAELSPIASPNSPEIKLAYEDIRATLEKISRQDAINERKALEKLTAYKQELKTVKAEKTGFSGYVANDLRTAEANFDEGF